MAGQNVIIGAQPIEWVEETSFATTEDDASWNWFGIVDSWSVEEGVESESITYLPEYNASNKLEKRVNVKLREMHSADVTYHPQTDFSFLQYFTGADGGTSDDLNTIQVGEVNESADPTEYRRLMGGAGEEVTISVEEDGVVEIDGSFIFADAEDWDDISYVFDSGITALSNPVTPDTDEVGVQTSSVDTGKVVLYDGSDNELDRVDANSSAYEASTQVSGTDVASIRLVNTDSTFSSETISVNTATDGTGTDETADVSTSGSHATEDTTEPYSYDDLSNVQWGGNSMDGAIESVELSISNDLAEVRDPDTGRNTQLAALIPVDREVTVDITLTYDSFDMLSDVRSYTKQDFTFDIDTTSFTITDVQFPELPHEYTADDLISDSLASDPASSISWS